MTKSLSYKPLTLVYPFIKEFFYFFQYKQHYGIVFDKINKKSDTNVIYIQKNEYLCRENIN